MTNGRPARARPSKPSYNSSTPSATDSDKKMGEVVDEHAKHSAIREALEHVGNKLKEHRENAEAERERKAKANLESERSLEEKRKVQAEQNLAHEKKLGEIKKLEDEAKRLKGERFSASLLGRTLAVAGKTGRAIGRGTVAGSKLVYRAGKGGYEAIESINGTPRKVYVKRTYTRNHSRFPSGDELSDNAKKFDRMRASYRRKKRRSSSKSSGEKFLFG